MLRNRKQDFTQRQIYCNHACCGNTSWAAVHICQETNETFLCRRYLHSGLGRWQLPCWCRLVGSGSSCHPPFSHKWLGRSSLGQREYRWASAEGKISCAGVGLIQLTSTLEQGGKLGPNCDALNHKPVLWMFLGTHKCVLPPYSALWVG